MSEGRSDRMHIDKCPVRSDKPARQIVQLSPLRSL